MAEEHNARLVLQLRRSRRQQRAKVLIGSTPTASMGAHGAWQTAAMGLSQLTQALRTSSAPGGGRVAPGTIKPAWWDEHAVPRRVGLSALRIDARR